jgi:hypothetical protein
MHGATLKITKLCCSPTSAQVIVLKTILKFALKIAPTRFGAVTPSSGKSFSVLTKVTVVKIANYGTSVCD